MTTSGGDDINLAPKNIGSDYEDLLLEGHDDDTGDSTAWVTVPRAAGTAAGDEAGANGPTNFNLRVEQNKIPEFLGANSKYTISAADFRRLEDLAKTNRWTDAQTYHCFANSLRNPAREWLPSIVDWNTDENVRLLWSDGLQGPFEARICSPNQWQIDPRWIIQLGDEAKWNYKWATHPHYQDHQSHQGELQGIRGKNSVTSQQY